MRTRCGGSSGRATSRPPLAPGAAPPAPADPTSSAPLLLGLAAAAAGALGAAAGPACPLAAGAFGRAGAPEQPTTTQPTNRMAMRRSVAPMLMLQSRRPPATA